MRFKRVYAGLVASVMALTAVATPLTDKLPFAVFGESMSISAGAEAYGNFEYDYIYGFGPEYVEITKYSGNEKTVTIPSKVNGKTVIGIDYRAFYGCTSLESVTIPNTVTRIDSEAFLNCSALKSVTIPESVTSIDNHALGYCLDEENWEYTKIDGFTIDYVKNTEGHRYAVENGFTDESCLITEELDDSTVAISKYISNEIEYTIPSEIDGKTVTKLGEGAFASCKQLTSVTVPASITSIGEKALGYYYDRDEYDYTKLDGFTINYVKNSEAHNYAYVNGFTDEPLFATIELDDGTLAIKRYCGNDEEYTVPSEIDGKKVTKICDGAYEGCPFKTVTIPDSITSIGDNAFKNCASLTTVTMQDGVTHIGDQAFANCNSLNSVAMSSKVKSIGEEAFSYCYILENISLPSGVESIGRAAFKGCNITSITIPSGVTVISDSLFENCSNLRSVTISGNVTSIGSNAFNYCTLLKDIEIPGTVESIGSGAFFYCKKIESITIPSGVTKIEDSTFSNCVSLKDVNISGKLTSIGRYAFNSCTVLSSITIPDTVKSIGDYAIDNCPLVKEVTIPAGVEEIGNRAIGYYKAESTRTYVKVDGFKLNYTENTAGHWYAAKYGFTDESCILTKELEDGTLEVIKYAGSDKEITIPSEKDGKKVTQIAKEAFEECDTLESVTIPDGITSIGEYAFSECTSLKSITIPDSVTSIGKYIFIRCTGLESATIPGSIETISVGAFAYCSALNSITISEGTVTVDERAFANCTGLTSVTISDGVENIEGDAFVNCTGLTGITVPSSVTSIGEYAVGYNYGSSTDWEYQKTDGFTIGYEKYTEGHRYAAENGFTDEAYFDICELDDGNISINGYAGNTAELAIPSEINGKTVTEIGHNAFYGNRTLTKVTVPNTVEYIAHNAFVNCSKLTEVTVPESVTKIDENALGYSYDEGSDEYTRVDGFKINYVNNSEAHRYALENGFTNEVLIVTSELSDGTLMVDGYYGNGTEAVIPSEIDGKKVTRIKHYAFLDCTNLTSVTIPDSINKIDSGAFYNCTALKTVTIPASVTDIGTYAFGYYDDENNNTVKVDGFKINYVKNTEGHRYAIDNGFTDEECFITGEHSDGTLYIKRCVTNKENFEVPSEINGKAVIQIAGGAFSNCTNLKKVTLPEGIIYIEDSAFEGCTSLNSVNIPDSVTRIGRKAFLNCTALKTVTIPASVRIIDSNAFGYRYDENGDYIKVDGFEINYLKNTDGHRYAIENGFAEKEDCLVTGENDDGTLFIQRCITSKENYEVPSEINGKAVTRIGANAFEICTSIKKVTLPDSITEIGAYAFESCTSLNSINIPDGVTYIDYEAFFNCPSLKTVTIPASVTTIKGEAFGYICDENYNYIKVDGFKIFCYEGTAGEQYAKEHNLDYKLIPSEVKSLKVTAKDTSSVSFKWDENAYADGYVVEQYKGGQWTEVADVKSGDKTECTVNGLNAATTYTFRVRAYCCFDADNVAYGEYSRIAVKTEFDNVKGLVSSAASSSAIVLDWERNVNATGYVIEQYKGGQWTEIARTKNNTTLRFTVKGLADNTAYSFRIKAYKTVGNVTVYSEYTSTKAKTELGNVAEFTAEAVGTTAVKLDWSRNTKATAYVIEQYKGGKWTELARTKNNYTLTFTVKGLAEGTPYSFRVKSVRTADGVTEESAYKNVKATTLLSTVKGGKVTAADSSQLTLEWNRNVNATGYVIEQYKGGEWNVIATTKNNATLKFTVKGLKGDTTYSFRMRSYKNNGTDTVYSDYVRIVGTTGLASVANFKGTAVSQTSVKLSWSKNANAEGYVIEQYKGGKWTEITTTNALTATVNGLAKGTAYSFRIKAYRTVDGKKEFSAYAAAKAQTNK